MNNNVKALMLKNVKAMSMVIMCAIALSACAAAGAKVTAMKDYTGNSPSGSFGIVKYIWDRPEHKGLYVEFDVTGFGELPGIDNTDAQAVSEYLVKYASVRNGGYSEKQYYYTYYTKQFSKGRKCHMRLYYMIAPEQVNDDLKFVFDYTTEKGKEIKLEAPVEVFQRPPSSR
jgi:hypothetical protein